MTNHSNRNTLNEFDMMVIRAGGRTQSELEMSAARSAAAWQWVGMVFGRCMRVFAVRFELDKGHQIARPRVPSSTSR